MPRVQKFPAWLFLVLTVAPTAVVGLLLWGLTTLAPQCSTSETERLRSPDGRFDLVLHAIACDGQPEVARQAALIPAGEPLPDDAASFVAVTGGSNLVGRWIDASRLDIALPPDAKILRRDATVAGIAVTYR